MARGATHVLGLDIGTQAIKVVELKLAGGEIRLLGRPLVVPTPEHAVSGGRVVDTAALSAALAELVTASGFGTKKVVASVGGDTDVVVRIIEVPKMTGKELEEAIQWELERQAPFPVDQAVYDYRPIERDDTPADAQNMEILLAVAQEEMVDAHVETLLAAKLTPLSVDVEPLAISRALVDAGGDALADQTVANIHIGASSTSILIVRKGLLAFVRTIPTAGTALTAAIRQNMAESDQQAEEIKRLFADLTGNYAYEGGYDEGYGAADETSSFDAIGEVEEGDSVFEVSDSSQSADYGSLGLDEAATQLEVDGASQAYAIPPGEVPAAPPAAPAAPAKAPVAPEVEAVQSQVYEAIAQPLIDLATEVRRSLDFYRRNHRNEDIDRVLVSGGTASIPGIAQFIGGEIGLNVEVANPFEHIVVDEEDASAAYLHDVSPLCVIAVGLAMRDMFN